MCEYCRSFGELKVIEGQSITNFKSTLSYKKSRDTSFLEMIIIKSRNDKKAGLMINTGCGYRYIDIDYCPFCGRRISE